MKKKLSEYSQVFAVGDIHGCKDLLDIIHRKIIEVSKNKEGEKLLIYLGDYIDRGPHIKDCIQSLIDFRPLDFTIVYLLGNHEQMLLDFIAEKKCSLYYWLGNGGAETLESYGVDLSQYIDNFFEIKQDEPIRENFLQLIPSEHKDFFYNLKLSH